MTMPMGPKTWPPPCRLARRMPKSAHCNCTAACSRRLTIDRYLRLDFVVEKIEGSIPTSRSRTCGSPPRSFTRSGKNRNVSVCTRSKPASYPPPCSPTVVSCTGSPSKRPTPGWRRSVACGQYSVSIPQVQTVGLPEALLHLGPGQPAPGAHIDSFKSIIDLIAMPGHERFVRPMISGATGIDAVLLVVAANEGVKPQTVEHINIAALLGLRRAVVAVSKTDLVEAGQARQVAHHVVRLLGQCQRDC